MTKDCQEHPLPVPIATSELSQDSGELIGLNELNELAEQPALCMNLSERRLCRAFPTFSPKQLSRTGAIDAKNTAAEVGAGFVFGVVLLLDELET